MTFIKHNGDAFEIDALILRKGFAFITTILFVGTLFTFLNNDGFLYQTLSDTEVLTLKSLSLAAAGLTLLVLRGSSDHIHSRRQIIVLTIVGALLVLGGLAGSFLELSVRVVLVLGTMLGIGFAILALAWFCICTTALDISIDKPFKAIPIIFGGGGLLSLLLSVVPLGAAQALLLGIMIFLGALLVGVLRYRFPKEREQWFVDARADSQRSPVVWNSFATVVAHSVCLGIAMHFFNAVIGDFAPIAAAGGLIAAALLLYAANARTQLFGEARQLSLFLPVAALGIFPLAVGGQILTTSAVFLLVVFFLTNLMTAIIAAVLLVKTFGVSLVRISCTMFSFVVLGLLVGNFFGWLIASFGFGSEGALIVAAAIIFLFILVNTFVFQMHFPTQNLSEEIFEESARLSHTESWKGRVLTRLTKVYHLTPREQAVVELLVRGRSAEYIAKTLFVSLHTVKAHVYHIYQKTDVHSKQDFLDLVTEIDIESRESQ